MWWVLLVFVVGFVLWMHYYRGMDLSDRIKVALEIAKSSDFSPAEGFSDAVKEDSDLVGWSKAGNDCVMLFRSEYSGKTIEIVDFASGSFHPGLVVQYRDGQAFKADKQEVHDPKLQALARDLLHNVRQIVDQNAAADDDFDGFRY